MDNKKILNDSVEQQDAIEAIRKKLVGKDLNYKEIYSIMDQIFKKTTGSDPNHIFYRIRLF